MAAATALTPLVASANIADAMTEKRLGAVVRRLRRQQDLTQEQLARRAGVTQGHLSQIETGARTNPGALIVKRLARALGVPVAELLQ
jgi:transcriptional regulator with XRE-family HTH domain